MQSLAGWDWLHLTQAKFSEKIFGCAKGKENNKKKKQQ